MKSKSKNKEELVRHLIKENITLREALASLNSLSGERMTLFVINSDNRLVGTLTDGDIRRGLLEGIGLDNKVGEVMNQDFIAAYGKNDLREKISDAKKKKIELLPLIEEGVIKDILDLTEIKSSLPIDAVLMAGGRGERLRPLTDDTPKPLLKVGGRAIIDRNVEALEKYGIENIFVTVNYLADKIMDHFEQREGKAVVECVKEPKRLGTMGSIALIEEFVNDTILLMNSDLLTDVNFESMYQRHIDKNADFTIATVPYAVTVPFAILKTEGDEVREIEEKPTFNHMANAGVYILKRDLLVRIKKGEYLDTPDFIRSLLKEGGKVTFYPVDGTWIDIGSPEDYKYANEIMGKKEN